MKHLKTQQQLNETQENLNISDVISSNFISFTIEDLKKAFNDGQESIVIKMKQKESYDEYGDMVINLVADKEKNKSFDSWYRENYN